jgi:Protein of unknown function (DUF2924).
MQKLIEEIKSLKTLTAEELSEKYKMLFGSDKAPALKKDLLIREIAYKLQSGDSASAKDFRAYANTINPLGKLIEKTKNNSLKKSEKLQKDKNYRNLRLPLPGTLITKEYRGKKIQIKVLEAGFEYNNKIYKSLSKIANEISGSHINGYKFFKL